jgi:hypothetical protein
LQFGIASGQDAGNVFGHRFVVHALVYDPPQLLVDVVGRLLHRAVHERLHRVHYAFAPAHGLHLQHGICHIGKGLAHRNRPGGGRLVGDGRQARCVPLHGKLNRVPASLLQHHHGLISVLLQGRVKALAQVFQPLGNQAVCFGFVHQTDQAFGQSLPDALHHLGGKAALDKPLAGFCDGLIVRAFGIRHLLKERL